MPAARRTIEARNPFPMQKRVAECAVCGENVHRRDLVEQRGVMVSRLHVGCMDNPRVFEGVLGRGPHYGNT